MIFIKIEFKQNMRLEFVLKGNFDQHIIGTLRDKPFYHVLETLNLNWLLLKTPQEFCAWR